MSNSPLLLTAVAADLGGPDRPLMMEDIASVIGALREVEVALFSWLGSTAPSLESSAEVAWASGASLRAGWRATQLEPLVPVSVGVPGSGGDTASSGTALGTAVASLGQSRPQSGPGAVAGLALEWYDALLRAYEFRLGRLSAAADGPIERVFQRLVADLRAEQAAARTLRQRPGRDA